MKKKPIAVVITDTHMNDKNIPLVKSIFRQTFQYCANNKIDTVYQAGDWFTSRTGQSIDCLLSTGEILEMLQSYGLTMYAIAGNHDKNDQSRCESFLSAFRKWDRFHLIESGGCSKIPDSKVHVSMMPYFTEEVYDENLRELHDFIFDDKPKDCDHFILITHVSVNGVKNNDGSEVTTGLSPNLFKNWDKVLVGHYHNKSKVGKNIYYIGSAYQANFGEDGDKGFTVIYNDGSIEQVKLVFPEFVKFYVDVNSLTSADILDIKKIREEHPDRKLRIVLEGTEEEIKSFNKSALEDIGVSIESKPTDVVLIENDGDVETISYNRDNLIEAFDEFCSIKNIKNEYAKQVLKKL